MIWSVKRIFPLTWFNIFPIHIAHAWGQHQKIAFSELSIRKLTLVRFLSAFSPNLTICGSCVGLSQTGWAERQSDFPCYPPHKLNSESFSSDSDQRAAIAQTEQGKKYDLKIRIKGTELGHHGGDIQVQPSRRRRSIYRSPGSRFAAAAKV